MAVKVWFSGGGEADSMRSKTIFMYGMSNFAIPLSLVCDIQLLPWPCSWFVRTAGGHNHPTRPGDHLSGARISGMKGAKCSQLKLCHLLEGKQGFKHDEFPPPPPPPPTPSNGANGVKTHAQCFSSQGSKSYIVWRQREWKKGVAFT